MTHTRVRRLGGLLAITATATLAQAQPPTPGERVVQDVRVVRSAPDGNVGVQVSGDALIAPDMPWIAMGAVPEAVLDDAVEGAPFTAEAVTETTQTLADGNRIARSTTTQLARDGQGRTRREQAARTRVTPGGQASDPPATIVTLSDPVSGERYLLDNDKRTARTLPRMSVRRVGPAAPPPGPGAEPVQIVREVQVIATPGGEVTQWSSDNVQVEDLGTRDIEGVQATGTRRVVTIEAGAIGNEQPIHIVSERWYSPELKTVVLTRRSDPRTGEHTFRLMNIVRGEPDPSLFQVPADYTVETAPSPVRMERRMARPPRP